MIELTQTQRDELFTAITEEYNKTATYVYDSWGDVISEEFVGTPAKLVESDGGYEGSGEYAYSVIEFNGKFYKFEYAYYSYNGCDYDDMTVSEVEPKQKTITVYE